MPEAIKLRIFIGSSSQGSKVARAVQGGLADIAECTVWDQGAFELGKSTLSNLYEFIDKFDFALFVATPDDQIESKGKVHSATRDNVIFEIGLFIGGLGMDRVIFLTAKGIEDFKLPSDLDGITHATFDSKRKDGNVFAAVGPACLAIQRHVEEKSKLPGRVRPSELSYAGAICFRRTAKGAIQYLLVASTADRRIFPKGDIKIVDADPAAAALRVAKKEAGVRGRLLDGASRFVPYFNDALGAVHRIEVFLLDVSAALEVGHGFRNPMWFDLTESITAITRDRDYNTSFELARAMEWADAEIRKYLRGFTGHSESKRKKKGKKG